MSQITTKELACLEELLATEAAEYEKFSLYAAQAGESAVRKLCEQLADRSREHFKALTDELRAHDRRVAPAGAR